MKVNEMKVIFSLLVIISMNYKGKKDFPENEKNAQTLALRKFH